MNLFQDDDPTLDNNGIPPKMQINILGLELAEFDLTKVNKFVTKYKPSSRQYPCMLMLKFYI